MTTTMGQGLGRNRNVLALAAAAAFLAAVLFASTTPADAKSHKHHGRKARAAHVAHHRVVPQVLTTEYRGAFKPYYKGRVYHQPHGHYHMTYRLPVYYHDAVVYRPYAYCGDHLFVSGAYASPQLSLAFNFGSPGSGVWFGGYYPAPPPPPTYHVYEEGHHHHGDCHHDHDWDD